MSTAPIPAKAQKSRKEKDKDKDKERKASLPQQNERLKTVVRRLPPNLPEDIFWQSVQPWVTDDTAVWKLYCPGKLRKKLNKENVPSRAYIAFKDDEKLALFSREYDGHVFRDKSGVESHAVVEFAPYPKVPSEKRKPDPRNATIEKDEDYISFLETLKAAENPEPVTLESLIAASQPAPPPKTTPLLEALKAEKSANKDKEAILRNHAHYNNITVTSLRKEEKKKAAAAAAAPPAKPEPPSQPTGKKAQKKAQAQATVSQTAKAAQQGISAPAPKGGAIANAPATAAKPAKPPRPPRGQAKAAAAAAAATTSETTRPPTILASPPTETATAPAAATAPAPAVVATARRTRPMIGLANRQFEAALSGVSGLASAATERKKREKEREAAAGGGSVPPTPAATATATTTFARIDGSDTEKPPSPTSPKKEKTRRGGRGGGGGGAAASGGAPQVKVPSILQRAPDAAASPVPQQVASTAAAAAPGGAAPANGAAGGNAPGGGGAARGGGRRGRGGGRGRGGAPNAPRGGG